MVPYGTKTNKAVVKGLRPGKESLYENVTGTQKNKQTNKWKTNFSPTYRPYVSFHPGCQCNKTGLISIGNR